MFATSILSLKWLLCATLPYKSCLGSKDISHLISIYSIFSFVDAELNLVLSIKHCVKSVQIRNFSRSAFFRVRTEYWEILCISPYLRIQSECGKMRTIKNFVLDTFHAVNMIVSSEAYQKQPPEVFSKKRCFKKFCEIHRKTPVPESFFNKLPAPPATLLKKKPWHQCLPVNFAKFLRRPFLTEHLQWLFLRKVSWNIRNN